jgi:hypothetical protein
MYLNGYSSLPTDQNIGHDNIVTINQNKEICKILLHLSIFDGRCSIVCVVMGRNCL